MYQNAKGHTPQKAQLAKTGYIICNFTYFFKLIGCNVWKTSVYSQMDLSPNPTSDALSEDLGQDN